ncbi:hypothetical protein IV203_015276 [Nitzschia inconspicua]|uniref:Uncharacterized protein n=1 Tax=Nitzschia inconspicua TaxID=303405 RepID=A0A9K3LAP6_9STRA|nr:hypothetical protein IV203_020231 [Nitzschia inconspicua]KAG7358687.1 hypothetical protein IV203_015276 [Nitzschia inconspicua]
MSASFLETIQISLKTNQLNQTFNDGMPAVRREQIITAESNFWEMPIAEILRSFWNQSLWRHNSLKTFKHPNGSSTTANPMVNINGRFNQISQGQQIKEQQETEWLRL